MITAGDFRNGVTFEMDGQVMQVVEFQHVKPGKGAAFVRTKMKSVITWSIIESYSGNIDINPPNVRFYRSSEDGVLRYALVDLDLGLFTFGDADLAMYTGYEYSSAIYELMKNASFRALYLQRLSEYLHGPLSDENFLDLAHRLADELRPETARDCLRWGLLPVYWTYEVETFIFPSVDRPGGHDVYYAQSAIRPLRISSDEWNRLFADLVRTKGPASAAGTTP